VLRDLLDGEDVVVSRCHQLWVYTRLFNTLFAVHLRRPFLDASDWQWSGVTALAADMDSKIQQLVRSDGGQEEGPIDMTVLLAKDSMKWVLQVVPQVIPFAQRIAIFQALIAVDSHRHTPNAAFFTRAGSTHIQIQRSNILEDSFAQLSLLNESKLKGRIQVEFISETGLQEAGIDGGGLFKAFLDMFMKHAFDPELGLFAATADQLLTPSTGSALARDDHLQYFNFIGELLNHVMPCHT
jgi:hypothetical protein